MKAIVIAFDSLNRLHLPAYGKKAAELPNFARLAERTVTFDRSYVCSMPCMPARRDFHTGRPNFFLRGWGPLEPFDQSMPQLLRDGGISTHLITDHYHYFEDGGATYHTRYSTWQAIRGQEGDPWMGQAGEVVIPQNINGKGSRQDWVNRQFLREEADFPQAKTFSAGLDFLERNHAADEWMLHIETFDPHEPFVAPPGYNPRRGKDGEEPVFDWPAYDFVKESPEEVELLQSNYDALLKFCDAQLGRLLDAMDRHDLWKDTLLIVWTDHGFLLSEHGRWAKNCPEMWEEISHTPFFVWDPRSGRRGERSAALVQPALDLAPTLLGYFGQPIPDLMTGYDLERTIADDREVRKVALFSYHDMPLHITDGRYVAIRYAEKGPFDCYTLMPTSMRDRWDAADIAGAAMAGPFTFTNGFPVMKIPRSGKIWENEGPLLFDLEKDPGQSNPIRSHAIDARLSDLAAAEIRRWQAPAEYFERYGFSSAQAGRETLLAGEAEAPVRDFYEEIAVSQG